MTRREIELLQEICPEHWERIIMRLAMYQGTLWERVAAQRLDKMLEQDEGSMRVVEGS